jgi:hypothetical protein
MFEFHHRVNELVLAIARGSNALVCNSGDARNACLCLTSVFGRGVPVIAHSRLKLAYHYKLSLVGPQLHVITEQPRCF